jgi:hypothetical protein
VDGLDDGKQPRIPEGGVDGAGRTSLAFLDSTHPNVDLEKKRPLGAEERTGSRYEDDRLKELAATG